MPNNLVINALKPANLMIDKSKWFSHVYHANLSDAHEGEDYWLHACGRSYLLIEHTCETRAQLREMAPELNCIPDERLTHYTEEKILLPHNKVIRLHIKHSLNTFDHMEGETGSFHVKFHIPPTRCQSEEKEEEAGLNQHIDWVDTAKSLIFHHSDLYSDDPDVATIVYSYMDEEQSPDIYKLILNDDTNDGLANRMQDFGAPTDHADGKEGNGWANLSEQKVYDREKNADGTYKLDADGNFIYSTTEYKTYYRQEPVQTVVGYGGPVMTAMMIATKNDPQLQNKKWTQEQGTSVAPNSPPSQMVGTIELKDDDWKAGIAKSGFNDGMQSELTLVDSSKRQIKVDIQNSFIRYLGIYVSFFDADDNVIDTTKVTIDGQSGQKWWPNNSDWTYMDSTLGSTLNWENDTLRYVGYITPINSIMAVPSDPKGEATFYLTFPPEATKAKVYGCGLGTGENSFPPSCAIGGIMTGICNLAIPSFLLTVAVAAQSYKPLYNVLNNDKVVKGMMLATYEYYSALFITAGANHQMNWGALSSLGQTLFTTGCSKALNWAEQQMAEGEIEDEIPFSGWIMVAINIATTLAQLAETITEVATSPWHIENTISTVINSQVTLHPDPRHKAWPEGDASAAYTCVSKMIFKNESRPVVSQTTTLTAAELKDATQTFNFPGNTLGGEVKFETDFYIDEWLAGKAYTSFEQNNEANSAEVTLYLVEIPKPLSASSVYEQTSLLTYQNEGFDWEDTETVPIGTILDADDSNSGNAISKWVGLALSQRFASIGMSWKSYGTGLSDATTKATNSQLYAFQNINIPNRPMDEVKFTDYGFTGQSMLVYDVYPPAFKMTNGQWDVDAKGNLIPDPNSTNLGDYYVDPRKANNPQFDGGDGGYHLRKIDLTNNSNINPNDTSAESLLSHARFPFFPDHIAIHPTGNVIGINQQFRKVMITTLSLDGVLDADLPVARSFAGTAQDANREGLLFEPLAVSCSYDGTILILDSIQEEGTSHTRIQAFDLLGRPVNAFFSSSSATAMDSPFLELPNDVTYLDMVAVGNKKMTYMYVLYYENDGSKVEDYKVAIYQYGRTVPTTNPLVITNGVPASRIQVDMWHTMYTLNFDMLASGPSGPNVGPKGRTVPSVGVWLPPTE